MQRNTLCGFSWGMVILVTMFMTMAWAAEKPDGAQPTAVEPSLQPVTHEHLLKATDNTSAWLMYGGNYQSWRYSPLKDIDRENIKTLQAAWAFQTGVPGQLEASPIVADGILYLSTSYNHVFALDAVTGNPLWHYVHKQPDDLRLCCGPTNRGVAIAGNKVFMATLDARMVALDRKTGKMVWDSKIDEYSNGYSATGAPLIVKDLVITGIAGGEYGVRGYIDAYEVETGKRKWRRYTIPGEGESGVDTWAGDSWKTGGGPTWVTGSYDPELDILYWATGNTSPDWNGDARKGDNLYTDSVLALDPQTGEVKWHFQFTPHDVWDYDGNTDLFLVDVKRAGGMVKALAQPNRNGYLYVLDRAEGTYLHGKQYVDHLNWAKGLNEYGRPIVDPKYTPKTENNEEICPGAPGGKNGSYTAAYSPLTKLMYVPVIESCMQMPKAESIFIQGIPFWGGEPIGTWANEDKAYGHLSAIDPETGAIQWRYKDNYPLMGGTLVTAGHVVFTGNQEGYALAFDDEKGTLLWKFQTGSGVRGQPITYKIDGRQYVAIGSGGGGLAADYAGKPPLITLGSALFVFALPQ